MAAGLLVGAAVHPGDLTADSGYLFAAGFLLAVGLFGSTYEIDLVEIRQDLRTVVLAVTLGVLLKASLIAAVMVLAFGKPEYLVLGIAVAQIDPLSVAAMNKSRGMSQRARALLTAWASFDDPMTVLLTLYFSLLAYRASGRSGAPDTGPAGDGLAAYAADLGWNLLLLAAVLALWLVLRRWRTRAARTRPAGTRPVAARPGTRRLHDGAALLLLAALLLFAAGQMLMLAVALAGLFLRTPVFAKVLGRAVPAAFLTASFGLGLLLVNGADPWRGAVLGLAAFGSQALIALLIAPRLMRGLSRTDRIRLGLGQQNGITAIILALTLERDFPGAVGIVAPAIVTINLLHYASNGLWSRLHPAPVAEQDGAEGSGRPETGDTDRLAHRAVNAF